MEESPPQAGPPPGINAADTSLFLDLDGTLVDLVDRPEAVTIDPDLCKLLERLVAKLDGRVAVVSGRSIAQLEELLTPVSTNVALVGSHGAEVRTPGSELVAPAAPAALRQAQDIFAQAFRANGQVLIEVKTLGVAIHYRLDPSAEPAAVGLAADFAAKHGLALQRGKMMVEVRTAGHDKGTGIGTLMSMAPFAGSVPIFLGDDLTDEAGFRRCAELGGAGILVGAARSTAARFRLPDVAAVRDWLRAQ